MVMANKNVLENVESDEFMEVTRTGVHEKEKMGALSYISLFFLILACSILFINLIINDIFLLLRWGEVETSYFIISMAVVYFVGFVVSLINFITSEGKKIPKYIFISYIVLGILAIIFILLVTVFFHEFVSIIESMP